MKYLILFFGLLSSGHSQEILLDKNNVLKQLNSLLPQKSFEQAYTCESKANYQMIVQECQLQCQRFDNSHWCQMACKTSTEIFGDRVVGECSADAIDIYADDGSVMTVLKSEFDKYQGNVLAEFLHNQFFSFIAHPGTLELESIKKAQYTLARGKPNQRVVAAYHVFGKYGLPGYEGEWKVIMTIVPEAPGVGQIARLRIGDKTWFLLHDY